MKGFVQRYPFSPKAVWWKRYDGKASLNAKRTIYVASDTIGFEINGFQKFVKVTLVGGELESSDEDIEVEYIQLSYSESSDDEETTDEEADEETADEETTDEESSDDDDKIVRVLYFCGKYYKYSSETEEMEEEDFVSTTDGEIIYEVETSNIIRIEKNTYVKKFAFDCVKDDNQQDGSYQPLQGLIIDSSYISLKTQNFDVNGNKPQKSDLLFYQGRFWVIEEVQRQSFYTPKERLVLHFTLKAIN